MDMQLFQRNRQRFPHEKLALYAGKYVAWNTEGTCILACDDDELRLARAVQQAGYNTAEVLIAYVPSDDVVLLGGSTEVVE